MKHRVESIPIDLEFDGRVANALRRNDPRIEQQKAKKLALVARQGSGSVAQKLLTTP